MELNQSPANDQLENSRLKTSDLFHNDNDEILHDDGDEEAKEQDEDEYEYYNIDGQPIPGSNNNNNMSE